MHVISTAGHVDHGKSTLVRALTGTDPDRFAEEKERGLTIDLGFATTTLPSGRSVSFVDVPGHVRFLKNMLAGVGAVDACVFIVAATEGWKPQSEEHLRILEMLGLEHGLVVLTKAAVADDDLRELARLDVEDHIAGTFLEAGEIVEVDSLSGQGLDEMREALDRLLAVTPTARDISRPRLWIDRSFTIRGSGTVITGTLAGGTIAIDDKLVLCPAGRDVRVRGIETHDEARETAQPGSRVALNLGRVSADEAQRGDVLVREGQWWMTSQCDAKLAVLETLSHDVSRRGAHVAYFGSGEFPVKLRVLGAKALAPGETGAVRLHLPCRLPLLPGDRFVLREFGRSETVGGGEVLDVDPVLPASKANPDRSAERVVRERGWVRADELKLLVGSETAAEMLADGTRSAQIPTDSQQSAANRAEMSNSETEAASTRTESATNAPKVEAVGDWIVSAEALAATQDDIRKRVAKAKAGGYDIAALNEKERAALETMSDLTTDGGQVRAAGEEDAIAAHPYIAALKAAPFTPPPPEGVGRAELRAMIHRGLVMEQDGIYFAAEAIAQAEEAVAEILKSQPEGFTVAEIRERLSTTRKYILPLLALLDQKGITRRQGDLRTPGPRLKEQLPSNT